MKVTTKVTTNDLVLWYDSDEADEAIDRVINRVISFAEAYNIDYKKEFIIDVESIRGIIGFRINTKDYTIDYTKFLTTLRDKGSDAAYRLVVSDELLSDLGIDD